MHVRHRNQGTGWPKPPDCLHNSRLGELPQGAVVSVAGLVLVRQRPGTAKGVIFLTLEDETGVANVVVWRRTFETFRRAVICGRLLRVTGHIERDGKVVHLIARRVEDISHMLDMLLHGGIPDGAGDRTISAEEPQAGAGSSSASRAG